MTIFALLSHWYSLNYRKKVFGTTRNASMLHPWEFTCCWIGCGLILTYQFYLCASWLTLNQVMIKCRDDIPVGSILTYRPENSYFFVDQNSTATCRDCITQYDNAKSVDCLNVNSSRHKREAPVTENPFDFVTYCDQYLCYKKQLEEVKPEIMVAGIDPQVELEPETDQTPPFCQFPLVYFAEVGINITNHGMDTECTEAVSQCYCFERFWIHVARIICHIIPMLMLTIKGKSTPVPLRTVNARIPMIDITEQEKHPMTTRSRLLVCKTARRAKICIGLQMICLALFEIL